MLCNLYHSLSIWVTSSPMSDDDDIQREIRSMYVRCNILFRRFHNSKLVNLKLFQSFCLCFYDVALWTLFHKNCLYKFKCCYNKCVKLFFGYRKQGRNHGFKVGGSERRRRELSRGAEGAEGVGRGEGVPPPHWGKGLGRGPFPLHRIFF